MTARVHDGRHVAPPAPPGRLSGPCAALIGGLLVITGAARVVTQAGDPSTLRFGVSTALVEDANISDATAAMAYWVKAVGVAAGGWKNAEAHAIDNATEIVAAVAEQRVDLLALSTTEYFAIEGPLAADPCMVYEAQGQVEVEYILVARAGTRSVAELAGKRLCYLSPSGRRGIGDVWLDVVLLEAGLAERDRTFSQARPVQKASQAVLPVFFNQADAALVTRTAFDTAVELNPQIGRDVTVIARSPRLLPGLICVRRSLSSDLRQRWIEKATTIHQYPAFRQTFMVLHMNRLVRWSPAYLDAPRAMLARYQALKRRTRR